MEKEKIPKQKPHTSFNRRQSVAKNPEGEHDNGQEKCLKFYFTGGNMTKGGIWQRVLRYLITHAKYLSSISISLKICDCNSYIIESWH